MKKLQLILALSLITCLGFTQPKVIYTVAGNGGPYGYGGDGGFGSSAQVYLPSAVAVDAAGNIYFADYENCRVRKVNTKGIISTIAGTGVFGYNGDGILATSAQIYYPWGIAVDAVGNVYFAEGDISHARIRKITVSTGLISTVAGTGTGGYNGDGIAATSAKLYEPRGICLDGANNLYIADAGNNRIRKVTASTGLISTVAGTGTGGYNGDGIAATSANIWFPGDVALDPSGNIFIADYTNQRARKVTVSTGLISTVAGTGVAGYNGDGIAATTAQISDPAGIAIGSNGLEIYIVENYGNRVRKVNNIGVISTVVGTGVASYNGDGIVATTAQINGPTDIAVDGVDNLYLSDQYNNRVRVVSRNCPANGGPDRTHQQLPCQGAWPGVQIGTPAVPNMTYSWIPNPGNLTSYTIAQPTSNTTITRTYTVTVSNANCASKTSKVKVTAKTSNPCFMREIENEKQKRFSIYPNPSSNIITINTQEAVTYIRIHDMQGKIVFETKNPNPGGIQIDVSNYTKGVYIVTTLIGDTIEEERLIID